MSIVIYPPTIDWSYMKQRPQHLMQHFARAGSVVLYFNKYYTQGPSIEKIEPNLYVIHHAGSFMNQLYPKLKSIDHTLYWTSWSKQIPAAKQLFDADHVIYDCVDDFPDWERFEQQFAQQADVIVSTAGSLSSKMRRMLPDKPNYLIPNGCDWEHFSTALNRRTSQWPELPACNGPRIGYIGAWAPWVDEVLIREVGQAFPDGQVLIAGPQLRPDTGSLGDNVHLLGYQDYNNLPDLLTYFDVCIIPFRQNRITYSTNPIKVYEYLAAGKPVVSTDLPELAQLKPYVRIGKHPKLFIEQLKAALHEPSSTTVQRSAFAKQFSWQKRFDRIKTITATHFGELTAPSHAAELLDSMLTAQTESLPLNHITVNSYYPSRHLIHDPPMVGQMGNAEYSCFFQLKDPKQMPPSSRLYFEFETLNAIEPSDDISFTVSIADQPVDRNAITYASAPHTLPVGRIHSQAAITGVHSLDISAHAQQVQHLTLKLSSDHAEVLKITKPRIVTVRSE